MESEISTNIPLYMAKGKKLTEWGSFSDPALKLEEIVNDQKPPPRPLREVCSLS